MSFGDDDSGMKQIMSGLSLNFKMDQFGKFVEYSGYSATIPSVPVV